MTRYYMRVAFFSLTLLHGNPAPQGEATLLDSMKEAATTFFARVGGITAAGMSDLKEIRGQMAALVTMDHLR